MSNMLTISREDIIQQVKISCQIPSIVEGIVTRKIITQAAQERKIQIETEELQVVADNLRLVSNLRSADATWSWLQKHCLSLDDFEELVYVSALSSKLAQNLFADKVEPFFVEHQLDYAHAAICEVVLDDEDLAMELFYSLKEGEISFPEVASQYIQDTELRRAAGYRGKVRRQDLKPEISAAVFAATPGQILKPIVTSKGIHLILVEELIQPQLDNLLRLKITSDLFSAWIKEQIEQVEILTQLDS
ncbi:peptidylprolyl isomerase [Microseira wollei]|uniref:peptidylprolyl isomerase n=1 Tax=Microseira wollei NIES-4236 TaxID=2530354 RepID=A0AAV3X7Q9_9CYAN|nr:peptidylprolyl isomerase [Microseira wollei]GET37393.1 PpiC-type peptidyl-prolyl cis-trans isomerase [Microseira wollei NIES-4236]